jgi:soluble lytic murein transglycosylase-like protein
MCINCRNVKQWMLLLSFCIMWNSSIFAQSPEYFERQYGLPTGLLAAIRHVESRGGTGNYEAWKVAKPEQVLALKKIVKRTGRSLREFDHCSSAGACGIMQILPATWLEYGQDGDDDHIKDMLNGHDSYATAAYILARKIAEYKNIEKALMWYSGKQPGYVQDVIATMELLAKNESIN